MKENIIVWNTSWRCNNSYQMLSYNVEKEINGMSHSVQYKNKIRSTISQGHDLKSNPICFDYAPISSSIYNRPYSQLFTLRVMYNECIVTRNERSASWIKIQVHELPLQLGVHLRFDAGWDHVQMYGILLVETLVRVTHEIQRVYHPSRILGSQQRQLNGRPISDIADPLQGNHFFLLDVSYYKEPALILWFREPRRIRFIVCFLNKNSITFIKFVTIITSKRCLVRAVTKVMKCK